MWDAKEEISKVMSKFKRDFAFNHIHVYDAYKQYLLNGKVV